MTKDITLNEARYILWEDSILLEKIISSIKDKRHVEIPVTSSDLERNISGDVETCCTNIGSDSWPLPQANIMDLDRWPVYT